MQSRQLPLFLLLSLIGVTAGFTLRPSFRRPNTFLAAADWDSSGASSGQIEQIEFKIYPDGRVEETVRGVKGNNCHKVTEEINAALGEVVASQPTEEMYEQELTVDQTLYNTDSTGSSDWEGSSSW